MIPYEDIVKNFGQFTNENIDKSLKLKEILSMPEELTDIFSICKNEIDLSNSDSNIIELYCKIFFDCLMQYKELTSGRVDLISCVRSVLVISNDEREVRMQYKQITKPTHILRVNLLKMLTDYKEISFIDEKMRKDKFSSPSDIMIRLIKNIFVVGQTRSANYERKLLNLKIKIVRNNR